MAVNIRHLLFELGIALKFINGTLELYGAFLLAIISSKTVHFLVANLLAPEVIEDPGNFIVAAFTHMFANYSVSLKIFLISYFHHRK